MYVFVDAPQIPQNGQCSYADCSIVATLRLKYRRHCKVGGVFLTEQLSAGWTL